MYIIVIASLICKFFLSIVAILSYEAIWFVQRSNQVSQPDKYSQNHVSRQILALPKPGIEPGTFRSSV